MSYKREDGLIFLDVACGEEDLEYAEAYNFTRGHLGYGDDMRDWENAGDLWGEILEFGIYNQGAVVGCSIIMDEKQFSAEELEEIEGGDYKCFNILKNEVARE